MAERNSTRLKRLARFNQWQEQQEREGAASCCQVSSPERNAGATIITNNPNPMFQVYCKDRDGSMALEETTWRKPWKSNIEMVLSQYTDDNRVRCTMRILNPAAGHLAARLKGLPLIDAEIAAAL